MTVLSIAFNDDFNNLHLCDVGAGAGFPSIPLKIAFPDMKLTIIDPLNKRMEFLKVVIKELRETDKILHVLSFFLNKIDKKILL